MAQGCSGSSALPTSPAIGSKGIIEMTNKIVCHYFSKNWKRLNRTFSLLFNASLVNKLPI